MRTRRRATIEDLRLAIDCLPRHTRIAMLQGIASNDIIVGAYANRDGICPMLAAHRAGGRTSLISFAEAWDRVAFRDARSSRARRATERELLILRAHLEASLLEDGAPAGELAAARRDHEALVARRRRERPQPPPAWSRAGARASAGAKRGGDSPTTRPGDADRTSELEHRPGWAWTRAVRRYDEYQGIIARLHSVRRAAERSEDSSPVTR